MQKRLVRIAVGAAMLVSLASAAFAVSISVPFVGKFAEGDPDAASDPDQIGGFSAYLAAARAWALMAMDTVTESNGQARAAAR